LQRWNPNAIKQECPSECFPMAQYGQAQVGHLSF
jgi:hypothetical protein